MKIAPVLLSTVVAAWTISGPTPAAPSNPYNLKPGAQGKVCQSCHAEFGEKLALPSVHSPVREGDCASCHNPHASDHGKLLSTEPEEICGSCHEGVVPKDAVSVHAALAGGACVTCHDPHASTRKNQLTQGEAELCASCHADVAKTALESRFKHPPLNGGCLSCHDPHASTKSSALLKTEEANLCATCHSPGQAQFAKAHAGYPVARSRCTSCHAPHGSNQAALLWENVHAPVVSKSCALCHNDANATNALATKKVGVDACRGCHADEVNAIVTSRHPHWPALEGRACLSCHTPHASKQAALLSGTQSEVCGSCHSATFARQAAGASKHEPSEQGMCTTCHQPHASTDDFLLTGGVTETCSACHDWSAHTAHPVGEAVVDPRNPNLRLDCQACHRMHGTPFKYLSPFDTKKELCLQCHSELSR